MNRIDPRLRKLLGGDELAALRKRLRRHFERAAPGAPPGLLRLGSLSPAEREALALLTGRPPQDAKSMRIDVTLLDATLRDAGIAGSLREALERIDGPIVHLASVRAAAKANWSALVTACTHPMLISYLQAPAALGLVKRLARQDTSAAEHLLECADTVLRRLPASGLARAQLAAETLGSAHALDTGQATATLVLAAWRQIERDQSGGDDPEATPKHAPDEHTRDIWARAGVLVNELARPALLLNLPVQANEFPVCTPGEPAYLSLRRLLRTPPRWAVAGLAVFVCENPNLVAIVADRLGVRCGPLVCTDGMPAAAQRILLTQLAQAGACLRYHGDFDWAGVQIANHVMHTWGAQPWRFGALEYEAAAARASHTRRDLADAGIAASWDGALAPAMQRHGLAIAEEAMAASLLGDLQQD
jgi:uncharacterized protein (TIGR02679 family)